MLTGLPSRARGRERRPERRFRIDRDDTVDVGGIELGMDVVDLDPRAGGARRRGNEELVGQAARERKARRVGMSPLLSR